MKNLGYLILLVLFIAFIIAMFANGATIPGM